MMMETVDNIITRCGKCKEYLKEGSLVDISTDGLITCLECLKPTQDNMKEGYDGIQRNILYTNSNYKP